MKIIAFTDLHASQRKLSHIEGLIKLKKPDLLICSGDISVFGKELTSVLRKINSFNIKTLIIPGNHELEEELEEVSKRYDNLIDIHKKFYEFKGFQFFGLGSGGFAQKNLEFEKQFTKLKQKIKDPAKFVFISHGPAYKTKVDKIEKDYVGSISIRKFIELTKPVLAISGHIHETEHLEDKIKSTRLINPGDGEFITLN